LNKKEKFGTFQGVFTPSILTILGVIMYLRFSWVLGNIGLLGTITIVTIATMVTILTGFSVSALSTNMKIGGGGAYFIISRSLGIEPGAAIGIWLYLAQAIGIAFYVTGFSEYFHHVYPFVNPKMLSIIALIILTITAIKSVNFALKTQFFILALIMSSIIAFFLGHPPVHTFNEVELIQTHKESFWIVCAVFFPAVTGILSGIGMSGDLKDPSKSLPLGTLGAVGFSYIIYLIIPFFLHHLVQDERVLILNPYIMEDIAIRKEFIFAGVLGATLSSALGSLLSAPRTLQALSKDKILPLFMGRSSGKNKEPQIATLISFGIALFFIFIGDLNFIAPILTMFTLTTYGLLNFSAAIESLIGSPSWRPTFKVHWLISLSGTFLCFAIMIMINPIATFIATIISIITFYVVKTRHIKASWGDTRYGIYSLLTHFSILRLDMNQIDVKNWLPNIIVFSGSPTKRWHLIELANSFSHGKSLLTVATVLSESSANSFDRLDEMHKTIKAYIKDRDIEALVKIYLSSNIYDGMQTLIKAYGFGPISPNTIIVGNTNKENNFLEFINTIRTCTEFNKNIVIIDIDEDINIDINKEKTIDLWWNQKSSNADLGMALAFMLNTSDNWRNSKLFIKTIITDEKDKQESESRLKSFIDQGRFNATPIVYVMHDKNPFALITEESKNSDFVFLGLRTFNENERNEEYGVYYKDLLSNISKLPTTALVLSSEKIEFKNIFQNQEDIVN